MREIKYLSPTSINQWDSNREEFYVQRLTSNRPPRFPQTEYMAAGSAFDAYVKSHLYYNLFGNFGADEQFNLHKILAEQVESQNLRWATKHGELIFLQYLKSGALSDLMLELQNADGDPRFEFTVEGDVEHIKNVGPPTLNDVHGDKGTEGDELKYIRFLGKPDVYYVHASGARVVYDWKVTGYCSKSPVSPKPGYIMCRDGWVMPTASPTRRSGNAHKDAILIEHNGVVINASHPMNTVDKQWAAQLSIYAWLLGEEVGGDFIVGIDQLCGKPGPSKQLIRVATHRSLVEKEFQVNLFNNAAAIMDAIANNHIFTELTLEQSQEKCATLDTLHEAYEGGSVNDKWFERFLPRKHKMF